jgi:hypothetical protein
LRITWLHQMGNGGTLRLHIVMCVLYIVYNAELSVMKTGAGRGKCCGSTRFKVGRVNTKVTSQYWHCKS